MMALNSSGYNPVLQSSRARCREQKTLNSITSVASVLHQTEEWAWKSDWTPGLHWLKGSNLSHLCGRRKKCKKCKKCNFTLQVR